MRRRVLLLFPQLNNLVFFGVYEPLVLEIFSAIAKEEQCDVELIDLRVDPHGCERLARTGYVPDIIGLTTHGFPEVPIVNGIAARCKMLWPRSALVLGGGQATVSPEMFNQRHVDLLVRGPGERIWRELCRKGVASGPCRITQDEHPPHVYTYPLPDRQITAKYRKHYVTYIPHHTGRRWGRGGRTGFTILTQGCPFRCSFCVIWPANLGLYRKRPIPEIVADLRSMEEDYVYLGDDTTFADARHANELADAIREAGIHKELSSYCRVDHICGHPELLKKWYDIGLRYLVLGIEALSSDQLTRFNKKTDREQNDKALKILREIGILAIPHILVSPDMGAKDFDEIYRFIEDNEFEYPVVIPLTPVPGTADHNTYRAQGRIVTDNLNFYTFMYNVIEPAQMSLREFDRQFDRLLLRMWSWSRYLRGKCGQTSFVAFVKWWAFVRILVLQLRWRRREIYRAARQRCQAVPAASSSVV